MGGICGFSGESDKSLLKSMCSLLSYRGNRSDYYIDDDISFTARTLENEAAIVKSEDLIMVFHGEIYNFENKKRQIAQNSISLNLLTDAALVLHLFKENNANAFKELRGSFACAIWNVSKQELTLTRDHFGQNTLYYCLINDKIFFASEIKPLLLAKRAILSMRPHTNSKVLTQYLLYGYVPSPNTLFCNIAKLPASSYVRYTQGVLKGPYRYWAPQFSPEIINEKEAINRVYDKILETIRLGTQRHRNFAILLSGGLDSSLLASFVRKCTQNRINSYTFIPSGETNPSAEFIADYLELSHHEVTLNAKDVIKIFSVLPKIYDDLIADPFISLPTYALVRAAQAEGTLIAADGADNIFWGLPSLYDLFTYVKRVQKLPYTFRLLLLNFMRKFKLIYPYQRSLEHLLVASFSNIPYMHVMRIFTTREVKKLLFDCSSVHSSDKLQGADERVTLTDFYSRHLETAPDRPANISRIGPLCSHFSSTLFEPFLDVQLVELASRLPSSLKQPSRNMGKFILRKMAQEYGLLPKWFQPRKIGLSCPLDHWYEGEIREWVNQLLQDELPNFVNRSYVMSLLKRRNFVDKIYNRSASYRTSSRDIFTLVMLTLWFKEYSPEVEF